MTSQRPSSLLLLILICLMACSRASEPAVSESVELGTAEKANSAAEPERKLRVLILGSGEDHLPRSGLSVERYRDLIEEFAGVRGWGIEWVARDSVGELFTALLEREGDIIVGDITVTPDRERSFAFTLPVGFVREQALTRKDDDAIQSPRDLVGRRIAVKSDTSFFSTAQRLAEKYSGVEIETIDPRLGWGEVLSGVASGRYDVTLIDSNFAATALQCEPDLKLSTDVSEVRPLAWVVRPEDVVLLKAANQFIVEQQLADVHPGRYRGDLPELKKRKVLRVLTRNTAASYFLWRGELVGFEFELAKKFAKENGLRVEMIVPPRSEELIPWLLEGRGDLVAASLTITEKRKQSGVAFSRPYFFAAEQVVARRTDLETLNGLEDLRGRELVVRRSSSYWETLQRLREEGVEFKLTAAPEALETEEIIERVARGEYDLTLADEQIVSIERAGRDDIGAAFTIGEPVSYGWAVHPEHAELLAAVNAFHKREYRSTFYNLARMKYFQDPDKIRSRLRNRVDDSGALSPYDQWTKRYAKVYGFDWRLITAQMYQESRFDPTAKSFAGARGLFQLMPRTAGELGVTNVEDPESNIQAGVQYLAWNRERFPEDLAVQNRTWMALAAFNAGYGHVVDARRLARQRGLDPERWFGNVEEAMLLLSQPEHYRRAPYGYVRAREPVHYVREIRDRFRAYLETDRVEVDHKKEVVSLELEFGESFPERFSFRIEDH